MARKRPIFNYKQAVEWIALNDSPADEAQPGQLTVALVADVYDRTQEQVVSDVEFYKATRTLTRVKVPAL